MQLNLTQTTIISFYHCLTLEEGEAAGRKSACMVNPGPHSQCGALEGFRLHNVFFVGLAAIATMNYLMAAQPSMAFPN